MYHLFLPFDLWDLIGRVIVEIACIFKVFVSPQNSSKNRFKQVIFNLIPLSGRDKNKHFCEHIKLGPTSFNGDDEGLYLYNLNINRVKKYS